MSTIKELFFRFHVKHFSVLLAIFYYAAPLTDGLLGLLYNFATKLAVCILIET